jgi:hypothetical protein
LHRSKSPGAGASTPFHDRTSQAARPMQAGEEIFVDYGHDYFTTRQETLGYIPLDQDVQRADRLLKKYLDLRQRIEHHDNHSSNDNSDGRNKAKNETDTQVQEAQQGLELEPPSSAAPSPLSITTQGSNSNNNVWYHDLFKLVTSFSSSWPSTTLSALPPDPSVAEQIAMEYGSIEQAHHHSSRRPIEWLRKHGTCTDHLRPGISSIPHAGRGAFTLASDSRS